MVADGQGHFHRGHWFLHWDEATAEHRQQIDDYLDEIESLEEPERQEAEEAMKTGGFYVPRWFRDELLRMPMPMRLDYGRDH